MKLIAVTASFVTLRPGRWTPRELTFSRLYDCISQERNFRLQCYLTGYFIIWRAHCPHYDLYLRHIIHSASSRRHELRSPCNNMVRQQQLALFRKQYRILLLLFPCVLFPQHRNKLVQFLICVSSQIIEFCYAPLLQQGALHNDYHKNSTAVLNTATLPTTFPVLGLYLLL